MPATRVIKAETRKRRVQSKPKTLPLIERTNALSIKEFISLYISPENAIESSLDTTTTKPAGNTPQDVTHTPLDVYSAESIPNEDLEACLNLIELTSGSAYAASGVGWSRSKKRKEMQLPDMKYLILRGVETPHSKGDDPDVNENAQPDSRSVVGFLSFMVTYEDGKEVVYCYEIHLSPTVRGRGFGKLLMARMEEIGRLVGLEKSMLTVFRSNEMARRFYERGGYDIDEYSPQPRKLRNGTIKEWDYLILSKRL